MVSVRRFKKSTNIIFLVDIGSPLVYLYQEALEKLEFSNRIPSSFEILFREMAFPASIIPKDIDGRPGQFQDVNLIGSSFLSESRAVSLVDYQKNEITISFHY